MSTWVRKYTLIVQRWTNEDLRAEMAAIGAVLSAAATEAPPAPPAEGETAIRETTIQIGGALITTSWRWTGPIGYDGCVPSVPLPPVPR